MSYPPDPHKEEKEKLRAQNRQIFKSGETIVTQGSMGHSAFYIEKGRVEVLVLEGGHEVPIAILGEGEIFGEMSLIEQGARSATVRAIHDTTVTVISEREINKKLNKINNQSVKSLIRVLLKRLRSSNRGQVQQYKNLMEFQNRISGLLDKAASGVEEGRRKQFREDVEPLLRQLDGILDSYKKDN